ncbi:MAG: S-layer homology domain-containing protein [Armatimonadota bacterium]
MEEWEATGTIGPANGSHRAIDSTVQLLDSLGCWSLILLNVQADRDPSLREHVRDTFPDFAEAAASFYRSLGVTRVIFELMNEPNWEVTPGTSWLSHEEYAEIANAAARRIRAVDPGFYVCSAGVNWDFYAWDLLDHLDLSVDPGSGRPWFDFIGFHPYWGTGDLPETMPDGSRLDSWIEKIRSHRNMAGKAVDLLCTERGWGISDGDIYWRTAHYIRLLLTDMRSRVEATVWYNNGGGWALPDLARQSAVRLRQEFPGNPKDLPISHPDLVGVKWGYDGQYESFVCDYGWMVKVAVWRSDVPGNAGLQPAEIFVSPEYVQGSYINFDNPLADPGPLVFGAMGDRGRPVQNTQASLGVSGLPILLYLYREAPPRLSVNPSGVLSVGSVEAGQIREVDLTTVTNAGGGILTGTVSAQPPFSVVAGGSFSLGADESQVVRVRFAPALPGIYSSPMPYETNGGNSDGLVVGAATAPPTCSLSLAGTGNGQVSVNGSLATLPWSGQFPEGTEVTLLAVPTLGWQFDGWSGHVVGMANPVALAMDSDKDITAHFSELPYDHVVTVSASADPQSVKSGGAVYLSATANDAAGHQIASWTWSDHGAGGTFYPSASAQSPVWVGPRNLGDADIERLLSVTATCGGDPLASGTASAVVVEQPEEVSSVMPIWRALLLVYRSVDADYTDSTGTPSHLTTTLPDDQVLAAQYAFRQFPALAHDFSGHEAIVEYDIVFVDRALTTLTSDGTNTWWPSPDDTRTELGLYAPVGRYDSVFVHWPQTDFATGQSVPCRGWGLALARSSWANGATYVTVANAQPSAWYGEPNIGEVWLHEWLHGVCNYYAGQGYPMPDGDADGAERHGYEWSPTDGWGAYYRDLMTSHVLDAGSYEGITAEAWRGGSILGTRAGVLADYFYADTTASYQRTGTVSWDNVYRILDLGTAVAADNRVYMPLALGGSFTLTGRVFVPGSGGAFDTAAVAVRDAATEYWATLAYGTSLTQRNNISIMQNDAWGPLYPMTLTTGWYTIRTLVDYDADVIRMKAWQDGANEPDWQTSRSLAAGWAATGLGFRHYGQGTSVDDLFAVEATTVGRCTLSINGIGGGSVRVNGVSHTLPWAGEFDEGDEAVVEAVPETGFGFGGWTGDITDSRNPIIVNMDSDKNIVATFVDTVVLSLSGNHGQVKVQGVSRSLPWLGSFAVGTDLTLEALPSDHYRFSEWSGDAADTEPIIHVLMDKSKSVTANFVLNFTDVPEGYWAYSEIEACVNAGIVQGYPDNTYKPGLGVGRDQMAVYISRALAGGEVTVPDYTGAPHFTDVPTDHWAFKHIEYLYGLNVIEGYADGYHPAEAVHRAQMAVYVARSICDPLGEDGLAGYAPPTTSSFPDIPTDFWAYKHIEYCVEHGVVQGYEDSLYHPEIVVTRDQMAVYVARASGLPI